MEKKYIVGIDFGHGETAAWIVPIIGIKGDLLPEELNGGRALELQKDNNSDNNRVIPSVVYRLKDGRFSLDMNEGSSIATKLKGTVEDINADNLRRNAYRAYIVLIVSKLLELNNILHYMNGETNFHLCMACPTRWNNNAKKKYFDFFNESLNDKSLNKKYYGINFEWIMNESDAAYFTHRCTADDSSECALVIDYGSSTIDYTLIKNGKKVSDDKWSNQQLGSGRIERDIVQAYRDSDPKGFQNAWSHTLELLNSENNSHISIGDWIDFYCRERKEFAYTKGTKKVSLFFHFGSITGSSTGFAQYPFAFDGNLDEIIRHYINDVRDNFKELKENISKKLGYNQKVDRIILSGGACIMPWVRKEIKEIFTDGKITEDRKPGYVVAKGIAIYIQAQLEALKKLEDYINAIDFIYIYKKADANATRKALEEFSPNVINNIKETSGLDGNDILRKLCNFVEGLNNTNPSYCNLVQQEVDNSLTQNVRTALKNAIEHVFHTSVDVSGINIHIPVEITYWSHLCFEDGGAWYNRFYNWIIEAYDPFFNFNWNNSRDYDDRMKIANGVKSRMCSQTDWLDSVNYTDDFLYNMKSDIKTQAIKAATELFYERQLFRTTFS